MLVNWEYRIVAIAFDCKSNLFRVRRFESYYSHFKLPDDVMVSITDFDSVCLGSSPDWVTKK